MIKTNKVLARIQFITSIGNHIGFFGVVYALYVITGSALKAGLLMAIQQVGHALAAAIYPFLLIKFDPKRLIILTQFISLLVLGLVYFLLQKFTINIVQYVYLFMTIVAFLDRIYLMATEYFSKLFQIWIIHIERNKVKSFLHSLELSFWDLYFLLYC